ncbi:MAG: hypothetical protein N2109_10840 [Fimbriimonadales bacterium]|nr:hypothetical protein [Fimbriimonadales bacterium]
MSCREAGYRLQGYPRWTDPAHDGARRGVPFVYPRRPAPGAMGLCASVAVLAATDSEANWMGVLARWCGLV